MACEGTCPAEEDQLAAPRPGPPFTQGPAFQPVSQPCDGESVRNVLSPAPPLPWLYPPEEETVKIQARGPQGVTEVPTHLSSNSIQISLTLRRQFAAPVGEKGHAGPGEHGLSPASLVPARPLLDTSQSSQGGTWPQDLTTPAKSHSGPQSAAF